jgi:hypothetical protein
LVIDDLPRLGDWILLVGSSSLLYVADAFQEISVDARKLALTTKASRPQAMQSVYASRGGKALTVAFWVATVGIVAGLALGAAGK